MVFVSRLALTLIVAGATLGTFVLLVQMSDTDANLSRTGRRGKHDPNGGTHADRHEPGGGG